MIYDISKTFSFSLFLLYRCEVSGQVRSMHYCGSLRIYLKQITCLNQSQITIKLIKKNQINDVEGQVNDALFILKILIVAKKRSKN